MTPRRTEVVAVGDEIHETSPTLSTKAPFLSFEHVAIVAANTRPLDEAKVRGVSIAKLRGAAKRHDGQMLASSTMVDRKLDQHTWPPSNCGDAVVVQREFVAEIVTPRRAEVGAMGDEIREASPMLATKRTFLPSDHVMIVAASTRPPRDARERAVSIAKLREAPLNEPSATYT